MSEERKRILSMLAKGKITEQEAEELLDAIGRRDDRGNTDAEETKPKNVKYLYVKVISGQEDNVDVRVPLGIIRAGMKLTSLIPAQAMDHINSAMHEKGMKFDFNSFKPDDIEELVRNLADMEVNVKSKNGDTVRVYCG
jgi:CRISPR/Cas system Type II protein with McrA/HNH and RuvC-like nuclease domain